MLRRIWRRGSSWSLAPAFFEPDHETAELVGCPCNMLYKYFVREFCSTLVAHCNISVAEAVAFSTHAIRRGAATSLAKAKVPDHIIVA